jgi:hypothetical protein
VATTAGTRRKKMGRASKEEREKKRTERNRIWGKKMMSCFSKTDSAS